MCFRPRQRWRRSCPRWRQRMLRALVSIGPALGAGCAGAFVHRHRRRMRLWLHGAVIAKTAIKKLCAPVVEHTAFLSSLLLKNFIGQLFPQRRPRRTSSRPQSPQFCRRLPGKRAWDRWAFLPAGPARGGRRLPRCGSRRTGQSFAAVGADNIAHVFHDAENGYIHHFCHTHGLFHYHAHQLLGRGNDDDAVHRQGLEGAQGHVAGAGGMSTNM